MAPNLTPWDICLCILYVVVAMAIILGNIFCLAVLRGVTNINKPTKFMMTFLSISDLCFGVFVVIPVVGVIVAGGLPNERSRFCTFFAFAAIFFPLAGIACTLLVNLDRYVAISRPLHYQTIITMRRACVMVATAWLLALTLSCLFAFLPGSLTVYHGQFHMCFFTRSDKGRSYILTITLIIVGVIIPIVVSSFMYVLIVRIARQHVRRLHSASVPGSVDLSTLSNSIDTSGGSTKSKTDRPAATQNPTAKPNTKASNTFFMVTAGFVIAWLPFLAIVLHEGLVNDIVPRWLADIAQIMVFSSSWWNVLIFYIRNNSFRKRARQLLRLPLRH